MEELGYVPSHRALIRLRSASSFRPPFETRLSNRFFETRFAYGAPSLTDYSTTHDVVALISHHLVKADRPPLSAPNEIVRFDHRIHGLVAKIDVRSSEQDDVMGNIAVASGFSSDVIRDAAMGRLLPERVCSTIALAASLPPTSVMRVLPGPGAAPISDANGLMSVIHWLAQRAAA